MSYIVMLPYPRWLTPRTFKLGNSWSGGWAFTWDGAFRGGGGGDKKSTIIHIYAKLLIGWLLHETTELRRCDWLTFTVHRFVNGVDNSSKIWIICNRMK